MTPAERMEAAAQSFADKLTQLIETRVELALSLERDRFDDRVDSLAGDVRALTRDVASLRAEVFGGNTRHNLRADL